VHDPALLPHVDGQAGCRVGQPCAHAPIAIGGEAGVAGVEHRGADFARRPEIQRGQGIQRGVRGLARQRDQVRIGADRGTCRNLQ
jgi:hypothetical protein